MELPGCGLLQLLRQHYGSSSSPTSASYPPNPYPAQQGSQAPGASVPRGPDFLDTILTHRDAYLTFPAGHRTCSQAFTELAFALERRAAANGSDGDLDTAIALHNEAWLMGGWYSK